MRIELTVEDRRMAWRIGKKRFGSKCEGAVAKTDFLHASGSAELIHMIGAAGEIALSRLIGVEIDESYYEWGDKSDAGSWEVKTSCFGGYDLHLKVKQAEYARKTEVKRYALMRASDDVTLENFGERMDSIEAVGWISREEFDEIKESVSYGSHGISNWTCSEFKLHKFEEIIKTTEPEPKQEQEQEETAESGQLFLFDGAGEAPSSPARW